MNQSDPDKIAVPVERKEVLAVCVMPDGNKLLWVKQPLWLTVYILAGMALVATACVASSGWDWSQLLMLLPGAGIAFIAIQHFPRIFLNDPAKPHHWAKR
jgi:hypothetical protein